MNIQLHKQARTTPAIRKEIQESSLSERALAEKYSISRATVRKWKQRNSVVDKSNRPHAIHTALSPLEERIAILLRTTLLLPLDDLLLVIYVLFNSSISRSALNRCLRRYDVSNLRECGTGADNGPGDVVLFHFSLSSLIQKTLKRILYVAVEPDSRWVYCELRNTGNSAGFLKNLIKTAPFSISTVQTELSEEVVDHSYSTAPTLENHLFSQLCRLHNISHHAINRQLVHEQEQHIFSDIADYVPRWSLHRIKGTIEEYCRFYNNSIPLNVLNHQTPQQTIMRRDNSPVIKNNQTGSLQPLHSHDDAELFMLREENRRLRLENALKLRLPLG